MIILCHKKSRLVNIFPSSSLTSAWPLCSVSEKYFTISDSTLHIKMCPRNQCPTKLLLNLYCSIELFHVTLLFPLQMTWYLVQIAPVDASRGWHVFFVICYCFLLLLLLMMLLLLSPFSRANIGIWHIKSNVSVWLIQWDRFADAVAVVVVVVMLLLLSWCCG